jgi:hypothetical protein
VPIRKELRHLYRGPAWKAAREGCRDRAGNKCEQCGGLNGAIGYRREDGMFVRLALGVFPPDGAKLVHIQCGAAHLNNVAGDDRPENLAWLCRGCHLHRDAPFHRLTRAIRKDAARPLLIEMTHEQLQKEQLDGNSRPDPEHDPKRNGRGGDLPSGEPAAG